MKQWNDDHGWGVLISPEVPGEVWAHFSHIVDDDDTGYRSLSDHQRVRFDYEHYPPGQDGYFGGLPGSSGFLTRASTGY